MAKVINVTELFRLGGSNRVMPLPIVTKDWPDSVPLDAGIVRSALWHHMGNITMAAIYLRVNITRLRRYVVSNDEEFADDLAQIKEYILDYAKQVLDKK